MNLVNKLTILINMGGVPIKTHANCAKHYNKANLNSYWILRYISRYVKFFSSIFNSLLEYFNDSRLGRKQPAYISDN